MSDVDELLRLMRQRGDSQYGGEAVTQIEHGLQAAALAEREGAAPELIVAALLHDVGHLLHDLPDGAPDEGIDDHHEAVGYRSLRHVFGDAVSEPVRLHVEAKRYLCATEQGYLDTLSRPSLVSLRLQGGPMTPEQVREFDRNPHARDAVRLRRWDDLAKDPEGRPPSLDHFAHYARRVARTGRGTGGVQA